MSDYDDTDSQWASLTEEAIRHEAAEYSDTPSWYWSDRQGCHVLTEDGETTTRDLGTLIAAGGGNPIAEADYWAMAASLNELTARFRLVDAGRADTESPRSEIARTAAEHAYETATAVRDQLATTAKTLRAVAAGRGDWIDIDAAWRQACDISYKEAVIEYGNDGPYECDRYLPAEDRDRKQAAITLISERTNIPTWYVTGHLDDATDDYNHAPGTDDDPDYFAPPNWTELAQQYAARAAADEAQAAWVHAEYAETKAVYDELFDHHYYGSIIGDGQAEDSYSDRLWEDAEGIANCRLAERGVFPPDTDDDLPSAGGVNGVPTPVADAAAAPYNDPPVETLSGIPLGPYTDIETAEGKTTEEILADLQVELAAEEGAATGEIEQPPTQPATASLPAGDEVAVTRVGEGLGVRELGEELPGKPSAAEAVAGAHAAVLASDQATRHDSGVASVSDRVVEYQDHTQDAGEGR